MQDTKSVQAHTEPRNALEIKYKNAHYATVLIDHGINNMSICKKIILNTNGKENTLRLYKVWSNALTSQKIEDLGDIKCPLKQ